MNRALLILLFLPATLDAQARTVVSTYLGTDASFAGDPILLGLTAARETGPLAARVSMGFDMGEPVEAAVESGLAAGPRGIWSTDADVLLYLGNPRGSAALIPYGVAGMGTRGYSQGGDLGLAASYSYGGGFRAPLGGGFALEGEARWREVLAGGGDAAAPAVSAGMEYRFGVSVGFGGVARTTLPNVRPAPVPSRRTRPAGGTYTGADARSRLVSATLGTAEQYIGVPYLWGGNTPSEGFDCSGFIRYVFAQQGLSVPRVSRDQARFGTPLPLDVRHFEPG
ncbi:MAG TPA: NlpC/P60 family protein, partial [Longimicrobiaceae bacterium]|nr:NlpC/P60 family protein [Longimicrobiaceae bacterium]